MSDPGERDADDAGATITYRQRPKPYSAELELRLSPHRLAAERGRSRQEFRLDAVERITLRFTPKNTVFRAFSCQLRAEDGRSVTFQNFNWKSLIETERQDEDYKRFVAALVARAAVTSPRIQLVGGLSPLHYWSMMALAVVMVAAMLGVAGYFFIKGSLMMGALAIGVNAYLAYWLKEYGRRNRPRFFARTAIPADLLPL